MSYMDYATLNIDTNMLYRLGFNQQEVDNFIYVYNNGGKFTPSALQSYGYNYNQAKRLAYMFNVCSGKVQTNSKEEKIKHLRKMFGSGYRISMQDLVVSSVSDVPRVAVINGIKQKPFDIWNSGNYKGKDALYKVIDVTGHKITVETNKKPKIEYGGPKSIQGILEIKGVKQNGNAIVTFDKKYCRLCNRFIIIASLKNPEFHLGKWEILCFEGTRVYVYATCMGTKESVKYRMGNQRVYDFGIFPQDIKAKLDRAAKGLYKHLNGVEVEYNQPNTNYKVIPVESNDNLNNDGVEF